MSMFKKVMLDPKQGWLPAFLGCAACPFYKKIDNTYVAGRTCKGCKGKGVRTKTINEESE